MAKVFGHGEFLVETGGLKHDAQPLADRLPLVPQIESKHLDLPLLQRDQRRKQAKESRLAAAVGPEKGEDFPLLDRQIQVDDGRPLAVVVGQIRDLDGGIRVHTAGTGRTRR